MASGALRTISERETVENNEIFTRYFSGNEENQLKAEQKSIKSGGRQYVTATFS